LFESDARLNSFLAHPVRYLVPPPPPQHLKLIILGAPSSGKSTQARRIAEELDLPVIDVEEKITSQIENNTSKSLKVMASSHHTLKC
jgi:hypothetical protein